MPKLPILIGFFLLFALTVKGQKIPAEYIKEIDTLFFNQDFEHALLLATSWESVTREKFGDQSLERAIPLAYYARAIFEVTRDYPTADSLLQVSIQLMQDADASQTNEYAEALRWAGISKSRQGLFPEAIVLIDSARIIQTALFGADHLYTLASQGNLINSNIRLGRYAIAETLSLSGIATLERIQKADTKLYQFYLMVYGGLLSNQHRFSKAIEFQEKGVALGKRLYGEKHNTYHTGLFDLARTYYLAQRLEEAESLFKLVIKLSDKRPKYLSYQALGIMQNTLGLYEQAKQNLQQYLDYLERFETGNPLDYAATLASLSAIYYEQNQIDKSDSLQLEVLGIYSEFLGDTSQEYLEVLLLRAHMITKHADPTEAQAFLEDISSKYMRQMEADPYLLETFLQIESRLAFQLGDFQKANNLLTQSLALNGPGKLEGLRFSIFCLLHLNRITELESTAKAMAKASKFEIQADYAFLSDAERQQIYSRMEIVRDALLNLKLQKPALDLEEELFDFQLFSKNILENTIRKTQSYVLNSGDSSLLALFKNWIETREQLNFAYQISPKEDQQSIVKLKSLEAKAEDLEKEIQRFGAPIMQYNLEPSWTDIRNKLKPHEVAIDVVRFNRLELETYHDTVFYAFSIVKPGASKPELVFLENGNDLESFTLGQYQNEITRKKDLSAVLYEKMWAPISAHLQGVETVYFSPDGIFHKINLNTLRTTEGNYLLENIQIKQVTNLQYILNRGEEADGSKPGIAVLFGNPAFKTETSSSPSDITADLQTGTPLYRDIIEEAKGDFNLPPLPGSEREVKAIAQKLAGRNWQTTVCTGMKASEDTLKLLKNPKVLHIATHGYFLSVEKNIASNNFISPHAGKNPALSSMLFFAGAENTIVGKNLGRNDGILTAFEAAVLNLDQTDLVVLSACNTGLGKTQNGEGVIGLQRAFRIAGAKSLIMSLWEVEDTATELLMNAFYENWLSGMSKSEAFRKAQLTLKAKYPQPFYWGSFILVNG